MSAFFIVHIEIPDHNERASYDEYVKKARPIVEGYGGTYLVRSEQISLVAGEKKPDRIIVIEFENRKQLETCFGSPEYIEIKRLRESSVKSSAFIVEQ